MNTKRKMRMLSLLLCFVMLVGLMPTTVPAADTDDVTVIRFAHATVDVPVAGAKPDFDLEVPEQSHYTVKVEAWKCDDDGSTLTRDDVFEKGKSYTVYIEFAAEEGWKISSGGNCKVNGDYAPGYDNSNEFKRRLSFDVINELIPSINVTGIKTPVAGELPDVSGIVTDTKGITFETIKWLGHYSGGPLSGDGTFKADGVYDLEIRFTTDKYYALADGATVTTDFACEDKVLYSKEKVIVFTYTIPDPDKLYTLSVTLGSSAQWSYKAGEEVTIVAFAPSEGKKFDHWTGGKYLDYTEGSVNTPTATFIMPAKNVFLFAEYVDADAATTYTVTFDSVGGSAVTAQTIEEGQKATKPADPTKAGYDFKGWTLNGSAYDFNSAVNGDITLVATWEQQQVVPTTYTVSFAANGGSAVEPQTIEEGGKVTKPADPVKEGFDFVGWTFEDKDWNFENTVTGDMTLVAVWKAKEAAPPADDEGGEDTTKPEGTTKPEDNPSDNPQTGDNSMIWLWIALLFVSGAGVVAATVYGKKKFSVK